MLTKVIELIEAQQKDWEDTTVFLVGEQLKDICSEDPAFAEIVAADLENKDMSIEACEKKIKAKADEIKKRRSGSSVGLSSMVADGIIREFYGLPKAGERTTTPVCGPARNESAGDNFLNLDDFLI